MGVGGAGKPAPQATAKSRPRWIVKGAKNSLARGVVKISKNLTSCHR